MWCALQSHYLSPSLSRLFTHSLRTLSHFICLLPFCSIPKWSTRIFHSGFDSQLTKRIGMKIIQFSFGFMNQNHVIQMDLHCANTRLNVHSIISYEIFQAQFSKFRLSLISSLIGANCLKSSTLHEDRSDSLKFTVGIFCQFMTCCSATKFSKFSEHRTKNYDAEHYESKLIREKTTNWKQIGASDLSRCHRNDNVLFSNCVINPTVSFGFLLMLHRHSSFFCE